MIKVAGSFVHQTILTLILESCPYQQEQVSAKYGGLWGLHGLEELEKTLGREKGVIHFGYRLGAFLSGLCSIFRPKTVVLSGGISESRWNQFSASMLKEFDSSKPDWLDRPDIVKSPYGQNAALIGVANYLNVMLSLNR